MDRDALIEVLRQRATISLDCLPEETDPADHFDDPADVEFARSGDYWHWFCAHVSAQYAGFSGHDFLGACSYLGEADFRAPGGYYDDMVNEALGELADKIMAARDAIVSLGLCEAQS